MTSPAADTYQQNRPVQSIDVEPIPHAWRQVLELHLARLKPKEIQEQTGYSPAMMYRILKDDRVIHLKQQIMQYYDSRFQDLLPSVVDAIEKGLDSPDKYLEAAKVYLKEFGSESKKQGDTTINITAEDVALQILQGVKP
jgi:hypothetical protein